MPKKSVKPCSNTTQTVTCTGAVVCTYTGPPVEVITMVPADKAHLYHRPITRSMNSLKKAWHKSANGTNDE
jgi:hypothetical protein